MRRVWLSNIRINKKFTHQDVADLSKIDRAFYTQIENGTRNPSVATAQKIAGALEFDWTIFFNYQSGERQQKSDSA